MRCKSKSVTTVLMENIEALRKLKGWGLAETATRLHISESSYGKYKRQEHKPPLELLDAASRVFGFTPAQLCSPIIEQLKEAI